MTNPKAVFKGKNYRISIISDMILRLEYDEEANKANHEGVITTPNSKITAMIVPTNEELMIARDVVRLAKLDKLNK